MQGIGEIRRANREATEAVQATRKAFEADARKGCEAAARYLLKNGHGHDGAIAFFIRALEHVEIQQREDEILKARKARIAKGGI